MLKAEWLFCLFLLYFFVYWHFWPAGRPWRFLVGRQVLEEILTHQVCIHEYLLHTRVLLLAARGMSVSESPFLQRTTDVPNLCYMNIYHTHIHTYIHTYIHTHRSSTSCVRHVGIAVAIYERTALLVPVFISTLQCVLYLVSI